MATDYISTAPWNDPLNPYPFYSQVTLSAVDIPLVTLNLFAFEPVGNGVPISYRNGFEMWFNALNGYWLIVDSIDNSVYQLNTNVRQLPVKSPGSAQGWIIAEEGIGVDPASLYIQPVYTALTAWEQRRRRLLETV
jgi:hypothetical protein